MRTVIDVAAAETERTELAGAGPDCLGYGLRAVIQVAAAGLELQATDTFPAEWLDGQR
jgi:hypothetical protein